MATLSIKMYTSELLSYSSLRNAAPSHAGWGMDNYWHFQIHYYPSYQLWWTTPLKELLRGIVGSGRQQHNVDYFVLWQRSSLLHWTVLKQVFVQYDSINVSIINSLAPETPGFDFKNAIFNLVLLIDIFRSSYEVCSLMTWVQVRAWCNQAMLTTTSVSIWRH